MVLEALPMVLSARMALTLWWLPKSWPSFVWPTAFKTLLEVLKAVGQTKDGHDFGSHHNVKAILALKTIGNASKTIDNFSERPVVHIDHTFPSDATRIDVKCIAMMDM